MQILFSVIQIYYTFYDFVLLPYVLNTSRYSYIDIFREAICEWKQAFPSYFITSVTVTLNRNLNWEGPGVGVRSGTPLRGTPLFRLGEGTPPIATIALKSSI